MRVLELGCGKATSSIFLAREFEVQVASEHFNRAIALESETHVLPMRVDAHSLPFAKEFFDAVVAIDSYLYFGTDERYLPYDERRIGIFCLLRANGDSMIESRSGQKWAPLGLAHLIYGA